MFENDLNPHQNSRIAVSGVAIEKATKVILLVHGRGATAQSMFSLGELFANDTTLLLAPQAAGNTWYPYSFMADENMNQPYLNSAIQLLDETVKRLIDQGFKESEISLIGFSQGACLSLEFVARKGYQFNCVAALSGGLIGEELNISRYQTDFNKQNIFIGCGDQDFHIPVDRVNESARIFEERNATIIKKVYPGMGHHVNDDEVQILKELI